VGTWSHSPALTNRTTELDHVKQLDDVASPGRPLGQGAVLDAHLVTFGPPEKRTRILTSALSTLSQRTSRGRATRFARRQALHRHETHWYAVRGHGSPPALCARSRRPPARASDYDPHAAAARPEQHRRRLRHRPTGLKSANSLIPTNRIGSRRRIIGLWRPPRRIPHAASGHGRRLVLLPPSYHAEAVRGAQIEWHRTFLSVGTVALELADVGPRLPADAWDALVYSADATTFGVAASIAAGASLIRLRWEGSASWRALR
jgi:hypothetical protein